MKHPKQYYRDLAPAGWTWGGYLPDEGLHFFQSGNYRDGFTEVRCQESEITDGSLALLIKLGMTR